ncbi:MAG TPA: polymer-forming cytoskeletal protein [Terriglobia bacterium]
MIVQPIDRSVSKGSEGPGAAGAHIGKSVVIKGELSGNEDLYVDGQVDGMINLGDHHLMVGPNGRAQVDVNAREVVILGSVKGNVHATDRIEMRKPCSVVGDLVTPRIVIEDGAYFKGKVEMPEASKTAAKVGEAKKGALASS